ERHAVNEVAAVRLQAHLLGAYGLRRALFPTTGVRPFFESLGPDALSPVGDESARMARAAAVRAAQFPMRDVLRDALEATAILVGVPRHPRAKFPLLAGANGEHCSDCM